MAKAPKKSSKTEDKVKAEAEDSTKSTAKKAASKPKASSTAKSASAKKTTVKKSSDSSAKKSSTAKKSATTTKATAKKPTTKKPASRTKKTTTVSETAFTPADRARTESPALELATGNGKPATGLSDESRELPLEYDDTKVVLLVRDPEWVFVYWEISSGLRRKLGLERGRHSKTLVLRVQENAQANGSASVYDVPVNDYTSSWYLRSRDSASKIRVTLGLFNDGGEFLEIATSNEIDLPRMGIADEGDVEFAEINDEIYGQIVQLSGGVRIGERLGSDEFLRSLQQRIYDTFREGPMSSGGLSSGAFYGLSSGLLGGGSGMFSGSLIPSSVSMFSEMFTPGIRAEHLGKPVEAGKEREFWLEVGVDVIVYGATEPNARVKFMGRDIELNPDGTFRVRMVLPDTTIEFPVEATSADGEETRKVKPVVARHTEGTPYEPA